MKSSAWILGPLGMVAPFVLLLGGMVDASIPTDGWVGRYVMELRLASTVRVPLAGTERSVTVSRMLVEVEPGSGGLVQRHHVCDIRVEGGSGVVRTVVPEAFVRGLPERSYPVRFDRRDGKLVYWADMGLEAIGFDPDTTGGTLPRDAEDAGVVDTDRDGAPGATVGLEVPLFGRVRLFIAQRSHLVLRGAPAGTDRVEGGVDVLLMEQRTLGAEPGLFRRTPTIRPDPEGSGFTLVRVGPEVGCAELRGEGDALFAP